MSTIHAAGQRKAPWLGALTAGGRERRRRSGPGDVVMLSPASTSFDRFANFMERGRVFKEIVNALK